VKDTGKEDKQKKSNSVEYKSYKEKMKACG
jgi:hypothetical protein